MNDYDINIDIQADAWADMMSDIQDIIDIQCR